MKYYLPTVRYIIFYVPEFGCTTAELSPEEKNKVSHRGRALTAMYEALKREDIL